MPLFKRKPLPQPETQTYDNQALAALLGLVQPTTRLPVNELTVLGLPGAWRAVNLIANAIANTAPPVSYALDGITVVPSPNIVARPLADMVPFDYWHSAVASLLVTGNFVALLADYVEGVPQQAVPIPVDAWNVDRDRNGYVVHDINGERYGPDEVFHVRLFTMPGHLRGYGPVEVFRRNLSAQLDQAISIAATNRAGHPPGIVSTKLVEIPSEEQRNDFDTSWSGRYGNAGNTVPALFGSSLEWTPITWSPKDAELLTNRQFSVAELAMMFLLDPTDLNASIGGASMTYANIEQRQIERTVSAYAPLLRRIEQTLQDVVPDVLVRFPFENNLRTDTKTRYESHEIALRNGWLTVNEVRRIERLEPLPAPEPVPLTLVPPAEEESA